MDTERTCKIVVIELDFGALCGNQKLFAYWFRFFCELELDFGTFGDQIHCMRYFTVNRTPHEGTCT